ncbi:primosomal protein N' [Chiayiivirga flava]|uniref:Replication restart protein PriA n=1 Tax=Chiayiivirga flava TaxID=659595 RepID=A0A7W8D4I6_9GAMM|nr:primosomal protein N' [Chiayiivirga flava]MBB5207790.1 primosomal protein N' (replication factor Y) [Chiayiivirga flava]
MPDRVPSVLRVALPLPLPRLFDYLPPRGVAASAALVGRRVRVGFGSKVLVGIVAGIDAPDPAAGTLREADAVLDATALFDAELDASLRWAAGYWQRALGDVFATALPGPLRHGEPLPDTARAVWRLTEAGATATPALRAGTRPRALAERLRAGAQDEDALAAWSPQWRTPLRSLARRGLVERLWTTQPVPGTPRTPPPVLGAAQRRAVDAVCARLGEFAPLLLDGVTGSGKTEVYLAAIEACLAQGRQALVLVPEIGLTPQALRRYGERLPVPVHALHSGLSEGERARAWTAMARGEARVLIGTRSAVFTPLPQAGLIVIDEEHDASYKQQDGFRYHARDLALVRGKTLGVPVLLGSATPSLETLHHAMGGRYAWLRLSERAGEAIAPQVHVLDVRAQPLVDGLSRPLRAAIAACLARGEQALVFRNRRGFAPVLLCHDCGWHADCERCDSAMTLHGRHTLLCHHCGARRRVPPACPQCDSLGLVPQGAGTERLEQALAAEFPDVPLVRVDRETTQHRDALEKHFAALGDGAGILVGTQMLAKGHDLPRLTLVAIASIDDGLFSADFRAGERLAQLLIQVAGRAGRAALRGAVWLQTHHPDHPLLRTLLTGGGYHAFAAEALAERRAAGFPPFAHLCLLRAEATGQAELDAFLAEAFALAENAFGVTRHAPMPAPMPRRAGRLRAQMLLSSPQRGALQALLRELFPRLHALRERKKVRWSLDVDPVDLY